MGVPIRARLTALYFVVLTVSFAVFVWFWFDMAYLKEFHGHFNSSLTFVHRLFFVFRLNGGTDQVTCWDEVSVEGVVTNWISVCSRNLTRGVSHDF